MTKYLRSIFLYFTINFLFLIMNIIVYKAGSLVYLVPIILSYMIYILFLDEKSVVTNQIILAILYNIIYLSLWKVKTFPIPMEIQYVLDVISIILILKITNNFLKYRKCLKDSVVSLSFIFIIFSIIFFTINNRDVSFINYIMTLRIYLRFLPSYIIIANYKNIYNKYDLYMLCILNILLILIQYFYAGSFGRDDIDGIFGISNVQALLLFFVVIYSSSLMCYIYKRINLITFAIIISILFIISGIGEIKMFFIAVPIVTVATILMNIKRALRFLKLSIPIIIMMILGFHILTIVSPNFADFFTYEKLEENIYNYTMKTNDSRYYLGRFENIIYTNNNILTQTTDKIIGLNIGYAMPDQNWYLKTHNNNLSRDIINLYDTNLYEALGVWFGYHFSSMNIIYLETGIMGMIIFYLFVIVQFSRSCEILNQSYKLKDKCLGMAGISFLLIWTPLMFYYPYLLDVSAMLILTVIMGLISNKYNEVKYIDISKK